jgi:hypothetical protein
MNGSAEQVASRRQPRFWVVTPLLASSYLVLSLFAQNWYEATLGEVAPSWAVLSVLSLVIAIAFRFAMGRERAGLATVVFLAWLFTFSTYMHFCKPWLDGGGRTWMKLGLMMAAWALALVVCLAILWSRRWTESALQKVNQFVALCGAILVTLAAFRCLSLATGLATAQASHHKESAVESQQSPIRPSEAGDWKPQTPSSPRDVYFLVFDRYGCNETLRTFYDFDNSEFYDQLEQRGFRVYRDCHSGYPLTVLAMASTLNMHYHEPVFTGAVDYAPSIDRSEVAKLFKEAGYKYRHIGNTFGPLRKSSLADYNFPVSLLPSEFADALLEMTPIDGLFGTWFKHHQIGKQFEAVIAGADDPGPTFTYAHFLLPHDPYVFRQDGSRLPWYARPRAEDRDAYLAQLTAANSMILQTIDAVLERSQEKPIIILQADEGPYLFTEDRSRSRTEQIKKRTGVLSAVLIPDDAIAKKLPDQWSSVNTFRFLLREYFGAPLESLPGRVFYWEKANLHGTPVEGSEILDVTEEVTGPDS